MDGRRALVSIVWVAVLAAPRPAAGHPSAVSTVDARTDGSAVAVSFALDATSVVDLIARAGQGVPGTGLGEAIDKPAIPSHVTAVLAYLDERFAVDNGGAACRRGRPLRLEHDAANDKALLDVRYQCSGELTVLRLSSTLFHDEDIPHQVIATVRHGTLLERYFFTRGEQTARVDLSRVPVPAPGSIGSRQFRMAQPPAGASMGRPASPPGAAPAVPVAAVAVALPVAPVLATVVPVSAGPAEPSGGAHIDLRPAAPARRATAFVIVLGCLAAVGIGAASWAQRRA